MKKILLITCFEPFNGRDENISEEVVKLLPNEIGNFMIEKVRLPVVFGEAAEVAIKRSEQLGADAVLCIGEAGGRSAITPEMAAINIQYARIPDNKGNQPKDTPVVEAGDNAHFSRQPVRKMEEAILKLGIPAKVSYSAGTYVCNDLFYRMLNHFQKTEVACGFIHVPRCEELGIEEMVKGIDAAIRVME